MAKKEDYVNPVHKRDNRWWFWDEIWSDEIGPFETEEIAIRECVKYGDELNARAFRGERQADATNH